jgi:tRNA A37 threonylcarbamoyladenosine synthetase subunit TsaC/SUA5/YrdC
VNVILNLASQADRRLAAIATANGAALFYGFGNFCALAAMPDLASMQRINALKGRPLAQPGSVTTDPWRAPRAFDWDGVDRERIEAVIDDFMAIGPIGFRGPASHRVPEHLTVMDGDVRTTQLISPGLRCPSNMLVGEILNRSGEDLLFITSANTSSNVSKQAQAAHYEMHAIRAEFGHHPEAVLIGHHDERATRAMYPWHLPCSTTIISFHRGELVLERHGSLSIEHAKVIAAKHGYRLAVESEQRVPVRRPSEAVRKYAA